MSTGADEERHEESGEHPAPGPSPTPPFRFGAIADSLLRSISGGPYAWLGKPFSLPTWLTVTVPDFGVSSILASVKDAMTSPLAQGLWSTLRDIIESAALLPPNLTGLRTLALARFEELGGEGITLYRVPRTAVARGLLLARTPQERRAILGARFNSIVADCERVLDTCTGAECRSAVVFTRLAIGAAHAGHVAAAQALAVNTLESLLVQTFGWEGKGRITSHRATASSAFLEEPTAFAFVMLPIWGAYSQYRPDDGLPVPRVLNRHASAHHVGLGQYSKRNTVQALMLVTALIAYVNETEGRPRT